MDVANAPFAAFSAAAGSGLRQLRRILSHDDRVGEEGYASSRRREVPEVLEIGAPAGGDRHEPAVRHVGAVDEVDVSEVEAPGGDRHEPAVRRASAVAEAEVLEVGAPGGDREPAVRAPGEVEVQRRPLRARRP